jgi:general secretion pathway protein K
MLQMNRSLTKHHGGALLTALFIMTLVAIVATAMSTKVQTDIYRTRLMINHDKLYYASQAVAFWAMGELSDPKNLFTKADAQGMVSSYPKEMATIYPSVTLSGELYDLQARYNLNNLSNKKTTLGFISFIGSILPERSLSEKMNLALAINHWVSEQELVAGEDNYLSYYLKQKPPYYPSHQLMSSSSELRLIKEVSSQTYLKLEPYITALPEFTPVNVNTAPKPILLSVSDSMNEKKVNQLIKARGKNGIEKKETINELMGKLNISADQITLESTYFLSVAHASNEHIHFTVFTILKRSRDKKGIPLVTIVRESFNVI